MNEQTFLEIFSRNLRNYMYANALSQKDLADRLGVGTTSVYNWCNGIKSPRMDKVDKMCEIFGCRRSDLIEDEPHAEMVCEENGIYKIFTPQEQAQARRLWAYYCALSEGERSAVNKIMGVPEGGLE